MGWPNYSANALFWPDAAVEIGGYYLSQLLVRYDGNVAAALAAYNAGPGFADPWFQAEPDDYDHFLEIVDFPETQRFLKQLYIVHAIYRFLYP
jgi:soluble lytic murein transglycosylase